MKTVVVLASAIAVLLTVPARTQEIRADEARDKVFGWMKIYDFKAATAPLTVDHRVYSIAQLSVANNFANWIQQSYVPVGGLGDVIRFASEKLTASNQHTRSLPQSYGATARIYTDLKYGAAGKVELRIERAMCCGASARTASTANPPSCSARRSSITSRSRSSPNRERTTAMSSRRPWTSRRTRCSGGSRRTSSETPAPAIRSTSCSRRTTGCRS